MSVSFEWIVNSVVTVRILSVPTVGVSPLFPRPSACLATLLCLHRTWRVKKRSNTLITWSVHADRLEDQDTDQKHKQIKGFLLTVSEYKVNYPPSYPDLKQDSPQCWLINSVLSKTAIFPKKEGRKREISNESSWGSSLPEANVQVSAKCAPHDGQDTVKTLRTIIWYKRTCIGPQTEFPAQKCSSIKKVLARD